MIASNESQDYPCTECSAGVLHIDFITYFTWLGDELITVPNFPAWICDVCGRREYDEKARSWLSALLNPDNGHKNSTKRPLHSPQDKRPPTQPSTE